MRNIAIAGLLVAVALAGLAPLGLFAAEEAPSTAPVPAFKPSGVELIEAGAEPRAPLRYQFSKDIKEAAVMEITIAMTMEMGGYEQPTNTMPTTRMVMELAGQEITEAGHLKYGFKFTKAEVVAGEDSQPVMVDALEGAVAGVVGMTGWAIVDDRGVTRDMAFTVAKDVNPALVQILDLMRAQLNQLSAPFPVEAVGSGAKWKVTQETNSGGMSLTQVATYTLIEQLGDSVKMSVTMRQTAPAQSIKSPSIPPGTTARLTSLESGGSGMVAADLGRLVPESDLTVKMKMNMEITVEAPDMPPQFMPMGMRMKIDMKVRPAAVTATERVGPSDLEPGDDEGGEDED